MAFSVIKCLISNFCDNNNEYEQNTTNIVIRCGGNKPNSNTVIVNCWMMGKLKNKCICLQKMIEIVAQCRREPG